MFHQLINLLIPFVQVTKHLQVKIKASKAVKMENTVKSRRKKNIDYFKTQLGLDHLNEMIINYLQQKNQIQRYTNRA